MSRISACGGPRLPVGGHKARFNLYMYRRIAIALLILLNALTPALSNACASSCAFGAGGMDMAMPCDGDPQSPGEGGSDTGGDAGSMAAMCAFAAGAAISTVPQSVNHLTPSDRIAFVDSSTPSFLSLPADKPPRT